MEPVLPDAPVEESEFDLDVRLHAVARPGSAERPGPSLDTPVCNPTEQPVCNPTEHRCAMPPDELGRKPP
jgi:hypothetical protein